MGVADEAERRALERQAGRALRGPTNSCTALCGPPCHTGRLACGLAPLRALRASPQAYRAAGFPPHPRQRLLVQPRPGELDRRIRRRVAQRQVVVVAEQRDPAVLADARHDVSGSGPAPTMSPSDHSSSDASRGGEHGVERLGVGVGVAKTATITGNNPGDASSRNPYAHSVRDAAGRRALRAAGPVRPRGGRAGHEVLVAAPGSARGMVERAGFAFHALGEPEGPRRAVGAGVRRRWPGRGLRGPASCSSALDARAALPGDARARPSSGRPDLIVRETTRVQPPRVAAEHFDVPLVDVGPHLDAATDADGALRAIAAPRWSGSARTALERAGAHVAPRSRRRGDAASLASAIPPASASTRRWSTSPSARRSARPGPVPRHRARARGRAQAGADDDRPPRRPGRARPAAANVHVEPWVDAGHGHAVRGGDGRPRRLGRDARRAGRRRADSRSCRSSSTAPPTRRAWRGAGGGIVATDSRRPSTSCSRTARYRDAAERVASEIRALPPVDDAVELFSRSAGSSAR